MSDASKPIDPARIVEPRESLISRYELLGRLGSGGMAEVFLARAQGIADFEKIVVLKRVRPDKSDDPRFVAMLRDEARVAAVLDHPNVVHTYDVGVDEGGVFIAMEYIDGEDLKSLLDRVRASGETIPLPLVLQIAAGAAAGLHHAHERTDSRGKPLQIVHRDVSPANIIVTRHSGVKLIDFGIAKAGSHREQTAVGTLKGKVWYMSPEQVRGLALDRRSDIFALGIVLYEMATTVRPFDADNQIATMHQVCNEPHVPADERVAGLPAALARVLDRALAKDPAQRYATAFDLLEDLERVTRDYGLHALPGALGRYLEHVFGPSVPRWLTAEQAKKRLDNAPTMQTQRRSWDLGPANPKHGDSSTITSPQRPSPQTHVVTVAEPGAPQPGGRTTLMLGTAIGFAMSMTIFGGVWWAWPTTPPAQPRSSTPAADITAAHGVTPSTPAPAPSTPEPAPVEPAPTDPVAVEVLPEEPPELEPEPTLVAPEEPARPDRGSDRKDRAAEAAALLNEAGRVALTGRNEEALALVEKSLRLKKTQSGYAKLVMLACRLDLVAKAKAAYARLTGTTRRDAAKVCASRGVELPP